VKIIRYSYAEKVNRSSRTFTHKLVIWKLLKQWLYVFGSSEFEIVSHYPIRAQ